MSTEFTGLKEFVIDSLIGEGGMGKVYRARQVALDRWVALKVLTRAKGMRDYIGRFYREARSAAKLVHPNIIQIYTVGEHEGTPFYAMELIEGIDLHQMIRAHPEPLSIEESLELVRCVTKGLAVAAEHSIVHRDIKPGNIMIAKGGIIKVMDFGLAKGQYAAGGSMLTQPGMIVGTPAYMSPEQGTGKPVDTRSDIYSLGCVLYTCLCDRPPFNADDMASLIYKHAYEAPSRPSQHRAGLPAELDDLCLKMLAKDPAGRFQKPDDLLQALAELPFNLSKAEAGLAGRVSTFLKARRKTALRLGAAKGPPGQPPQPQKQGAATMIYAQQDAAAGIEPLAGLRDGKTITQGRLEGPVPPSLPGVAAGRRMDVQVKPALAKPSDQPPTPLATPTPVEQPTPLPAPSPVPLARTRLSSLASIFREQFQRLRDGRWSYRTELGSCSSAEGLVQALPTPYGEKPSGLGDCLLCVNWNKNLGCALAYSHYLEVQKQYWGLPLLTRQAYAWAGAGRFDMAINLLSGHVREHPEDPEGYRELARIYDRPDYEGLDKRRAIVLYQRFAEQARKAGNFSEFEIARAEEHATALMNAPVEPKKLGIAAGTGVVFQCFQRGAAACFAYGVVTCDRLVLARAGEADPESGVYALEVCGSKALSTTVYRLWRKKAALSQTRQELARLSRLALEDLVKDQACIAVIGAGEMSQVGLTMDRPSKMWCLTLKAAKVHELLFPETATFAAEQCHEALRRQVAARGVRK